MDKVESVAHNDERKLVRQFSLFQEILYSLSIIAVTFSANSTVTFDENKNNNGHK